MTHYGSQDSVLIENSVLGKSRWFSPSDCKNDASVPFKIFISVADKHYFGMGEVSDLTVPVTQKISYFLNL